MDQLEMKKLAARAALKYVKPDTIVGVGSGSTVNCFIEDLGELKGYYNKVLRQKQIHINYNLNESETIYTCSHELGHSQLHPDVNSVFLASKTLLSVDKLEIQANLFAMELLIPDEFLMEYQEYTIEQIAKMLGYSEELIKLKIK